MTPGVLPPASSITDEQLAAMGMERIPGGFKYGPPPTTGLPDLPLKGDIFGGFRPIINEMLAIFTRRDEELVKSRATADKIQLACALIRAGHPAATVATVVENVLRDLGGQS